MSIALDEKEYELALELNKKQRAIERRKSRRRKNSKVQKLTFADGQIAILKRYRNDPNRNRLLAEKNMLSLLEEIKIPAPRMLVSNEADQLAILEFVEGQPNPTPNQNDLKAFVAFQKNIHFASSKLSAKQLPLAADAVLSSNHIRGQIETS